EFVHESVDLPVGGVDLPPEGRLVRRRALRSAIAGVKDRQSDDFIALIPDDDVVVGEFAVVRMTGSLEIDVQHVRLCVVRRPKISMWRSQYHRYEWKKSGYVLGGHTCFLRCNFFMQGVTKATACCGVGYAVS
ncbi:MAG TPA: hypothetical protein VGA18_07090, partial [Rhodothermales bacterium]